MMKTFDGRPYEYAQYKIDGHSLRVMKSLSGVVRAYTSHPHDLTDDVKSFLPAGLFVRVPCDLTLWGELWVPGEPASFVKSAIKNGDRRLRFSTWQIERTTYAVRHVGHVLDECEKLCEVWGVEWVPHIRCSPLNTAADIIEKPLPVWHGHPIEGWVFKNGDGHESAKWKPTKTMDVVVTGFREGRGKYLGLVGALECAVYDRYARPGDEPAELLPVANVSGMDDATRIEISADESFYAGRVCEVKYQYVGSKARLRHPRFVRWRDDKRPECCLQDQDHDLKKRRALIEKDYER
jgi:hypothetical protein